MPKMVKKVILKLFQIFAYAEGALLPSILSIAIINWISGKGHFLVVIVGASHGIVFTIYFLLVPLVALVLHWPAKTIFIAFSVAFIPFATWSFEKRVRVRQ